MTAAEHSRVWNEVCKRMTAMQWAAGKAYLSLDEQNNQLRLALFAQTIALAYQDEAAGIKD